MSESVELIDQDIRDRITGSSNVKDLRRAQFVKAGAGAGKTYSIKNRILNSVTKLNLNPERMVVITYTTKAANELLTRIRETLESAGQREAIEKLPYAKISTFHSFCYDLLREYPIEFALDPNLELSDEQSTNILLDICFNTMIENSNSVENGDDFENEKLLFLETLNSFESKEKEIKKLKDTLLVLYQNRDLKPYKVDLSQFRDPSHIRTDIESIIKDHYNYSKLVLEEIIPGKEDDTLYTYVKEELASKLSTLTEEEYVENILKSREVRKAGRLGRKNSFCNENLVSEYREVTKKFHELIEEEVNVNSINNYNFSIDIYNYFFYVVDRYKKLSGIIDFFDCLYLVRNALNDNLQLRKLVQNRFDMIIIDEFQDSDPMQADIAFLIAGDHTEKLFFVGDPKQSIFSFSRADIGVYLDVMAKVESLNNGEVLELCTNFRSSKGVLDFINNNFSSILSDLDYSDMQFSKSNSDLDSSVEKWIFNPNLDGEENCGSDLLHEREAFIVAKEISGKINSGRYKPGEFMILFRAGTHMSKYEDALKLYNIPVINTKSSGFLSRSDIIELLNLLALCAFPKDKYFKYAVKNSYLYMLDDNVLESCLNTTNSFVQKFRMLTSKSGLVSLSIECEGSDYINFIENLISITQKELKVENYNINSTFSKLFEQALNGNSYRNSSMSDESLYIDTVEPNAVKLMTIHSAKGLEARVVFLCAHSGKPFQSDKYVDRENNMILPPSPYISKKKAEKLKLDEMVDLYELADNIREAENNRLLYVAVTRAVERFILLCKPSNNYSFIDPLLNANGYTSIVNNFKDYNDEYEVVKNNSDIEYSKITTFEEPSYDKFYINDNRSIAVTSLIEDRDVFEGIKGRKNGLEFGSFVHKIMEYICNIIFINNSSNLDSEKIVDILHQENEVRFSEEYIIEIKEMVDSFISSPLANEIITAKNIQTELNFYANGFHGIMDLIIETDDSIKVIDFKSDILNVNSEDIKAHYNKQMHYYIRAMKESFPNKNIHGECYYLFNKAK